MPQVIAGFGPNKQVDREVCKNRYGLTNINAPESDGNRGDVRACMRTCVMTFMMKGMKT